MVKKGIYTIILLLLAAITVIKLRNNKEITENRSFRYDSNKPVGVKALVVREEPVSQSRSYTGFFEARKETRISADVQGRIVRMTVEQGDIVGTDQVLVLLDKTLPELQLKSINVQIEGLENDLKRYSLLKEADAIQGVQLEKTGLALQAARIQQMTIEQQIERTSVRAPFRGVVTARLSEAGAYAAPGIPLLQISDISSLKLSINVPERDLKYFTPGTVCDVTADALPGTRFSGKVIMSGSKSNPGNSFPVQLLVENTPDLALKSGMFGRVTLLTANSAPGILLPAIAISGTNIHPKVFSIANGKAMLKDITISDRIGNMVLVSSGLSDGEQVVTGGFINLSDGTPVEIK